MRKINKEYLLEIWPFWTVLFINYYFLPLFMKDTGSGMFIFLLLMPLIIFLLAFVHGILKSFDIYFILAVFLFFLPSMYFIYGVTDVFIYIVMYTVLALIAEILGMLIRKVR